MTTRHNFGFLLLDRLSEQLQKQHSLKPTERREIPGFARWETYPWEEQSVTLFWPLTYMNLSGEAVVGWLSKSVVPEEFSTREDLLVAFDDMSLPLGRVRVRAKGSSGGHNGLKSMEANLGHSEYSRLKLGIGRPADNDIVDYVLCPFPDQELGVVDEVLTFSVPWILEWLSGATLESLSSGVNGWRAEATGVSEKAKSEEQV